MNDVDESEEVSPPSETEDETADDNPALESIEMTEAERSEYQTLANGILTPRHRRFCQLAASGLSNKEIGAELGYVKSRVSVLLRNPYIQAEIRRLQDRIFEETIQQRLKAFAEPALNNIQMILTDRSNRVKITEKAEMSKWVIEKLDGKATQKHDVGENLLGVLMDRLDSRTTSSRSAPAPILDVSPDPSSSPSTPFHQPPPTQTLALPSSSSENEDEFEKWVREFASTQGD